MTSPLYGSILKVIREGGFAASPGPFSSRFNRATGYEGIFSALSNPQPLSSGLSASILKALNAKPKVFVSYHHGRDRWYYSEFSRVFGDTYEVCDDNSIDRVIDSDDADYVMRRIRENHLTGTSCTIVLCGAETPWRKFVDWEIKATLDKRHGLIGVNLPTNPRDRFGRVHVPERLHDNIESGFARWIDWEALISGGPQTLQTSLQMTRLSSRLNIRNDRPTRKRNG